MLRRIGMEGPVGARALLGFDFRIHSMSNESYNPRKMLNVTFGLGAEIDVLPGPLFLEGDLRGHLVLASFSNPRWIVASIGIGIDRVGKDPG